MGVATSCRDTGDVRVRAIDETTPLTAEGRVETGGGERRHHGVLRVAGSTTVGARR